MLNGIMAVKPARELRIQQRAGIDLLIRGQGLARHLSVPMLLLFTVRHVDHLTIPPDLRLHLLASPLPTALVRARC